MFGIGSNIKVLQSIRRLDQADRAVASTSERLASGRRINRAADDAAGLAVASLLDADRRVASQGARNVGQAASLLNVAEGALGALADISTRQAELAAQASNGVYSAAQRKALDAEARALASEFTRITSSVSFNGVRLFASGGGTNLSVQAGGSQIASGFGAVLARVTGDGTFRSGGTLPSASSFDTSVADVNGDGRQDVLAPSVDGFTVYLGNGDGTFLAARTAASPGTGFEIHVDTADFDGDGRLDVALAADELTVFLGNGDGTFKAARRLSTGQTRDWVETADFNGDGRADVVSGDNTLGTVNVSLGNGDGTFRAGVSSFASSNVRSGDVGDVNGDGRADLVMATTPGGNDVVVLLGNGDGTFKAGVGYQPSAVQEVHLVDVNHDGFSDVVYNANYYDQVGVLFGNGDGTFKAAKTSAIGGTAYDSVVGDINGDGEIDLLATSYSPDGLRVLLGNGDGTFRHGQLAPVAGGVVQGPSLGDFDGDGADDVVVPGFASTLQLLLGNPRKDAGAAQLDLTSAEAAKRSLELVTAQSARVTSERATLGVFRTRLEAASRNLDRRVATTTEAHSRIVDVDVAAEVAARTAGSVRRDAAVAVLAQANQTPRLALTLLSDLRPAGRRG